MKQKRCGLLMYKERTLFQMMERLLTNFERANIIRVHRRYENADSPEETKLPILISRKENFTKLLIKHIHHKIFHLGTSHTLAEIRNTYWIPKGRPTVKTVLKKCSLCRRLQGESYQIKQMSPCWPKYQSIKSIKICSL